jgi:hypothetical protein
MACCGLLLIFALFYIQLRHECAMML